MRLALAIVVLLAASTAQAKPWECVLWPKTCQAPAPVQIPALEPPAAAVEPIQAAPPVVPVQPAPQAEPTLAPPVVAKPVPLPKPAAKPRPRVKSKFAKPKHKPVVDAGPNLPWPWWMVRLQSGKTTAQLRAEGRSRGITLTAKQERQALACLGRTGRAT